MSNEAETAAAAIEFTASAVVHTIDGTIEAVISQDGVELGSATVIPRRDGRPGVEAAGDCPDAWLDSDILAWVDAAAFDEDEARAAWEHEREYEAPDRQEVFAAIVGAIGMAL